MKNRYTVTISDLNIAFHTEYEEAYVTSLAAEVTERMELVLRASRYSSKLDAALLVLMEAVDAEHRLTEEKAALEKELGSLKLDLAIAQAENEKLTEKKHSQKKGDGGSETL